LCMIRATPRSPVLYSARLLWRPVTSRVRAVSTVLRKTLVRSPSFVAAHPLVARVTTTPAPPGLVEALVRYADVAVFATHADMKRATPRGVDSDSLSKTRRSAQQKLGRPTVGEPKVAVLITRSPAGSRRVRPCRERAATVSIRTKYSTTNG